MVTNIHVVRRIFGLTPAAAPSRGLVRAFVREEAARAWIVEQETTERTRRDVNPFHFSEDLADCTSMPAEVLHDWLLDHDFPGFDLHGALGWEDWWEVHAEGFSPEQREWLWRVLDRVAFFEVLSVPNLAHIRADARQVLILVVFKPGERNPRGRFTDRLVRTMSEAANWTGQPLSIPLRLVVS